MGEWGGGIDSAVTKEARYLKLGEILRSNWYSKAWVGYCIFLLLFSSGKLWGELGYSCFRHPWTIKYVAIAQVYTFDPPLSINFWIGSENTWDARILNKNLEVTRFFEKKSTLVHKYKPHEARFYAARFFSGTKICVSRGLAVSTNFRFMQKPQLLLKPCKHH